MKIELSPTRELNFGLFIGAKKMCIPSISAFSPARELDFVHFHNFRYFDGIQEIELSPAPQLDLKPPGVFQNLIFFSI